MGKKKITGWKGALNADQRKHLAGERITTKAQFIEVRAAQTRMRDRSLAEGFDAGVSEPCFSCRSIESTLIMAGFLGPKEANK